MTPKEKAKELVFNYTKLITNNQSYAHDIECALILVDEIDLILQKSTPKDDPYYN